MSDATWSNVGVDIQSAALGTSLTVSGISKAAAAVVSYAAGDTDPANGDYMLIEATGMRQINNMVVRVSAVDAVNNTFACEGLDSTDFDTFVSATCKPITFGKSFSTLIDITMSGGEAKYGDNSDMHSDMDKEIPVGFSALKITSNSRFTPSDAALLECLDASRSQTPRAIKIRYANGSKFAAYCFVGASMAPGGSKGSVVTTPLAFSAQGFPSSWAT
jgi:hypothetical protein